MDFDWPMKQIWVGYINPYKGIECPYCFDEDSGISNGYAKEAREYKKSFYGYMNDWDYIKNPYNPRQQYCPKAKPYSIEKWEYDFLVGDNEWATRKRLFGNGEIPSFENFGDYFLKYGDLGFDSCIEHALTEEYCRRNGYKTLCPHCNGTGLVFMDNNIKHLHEEWCPVEPPEGEGFQLWENTSEGSPSSPVFGTLEELCEWCADNATTFASERATKDEWMAMLDKNFVYHKEGNILFM